ncbi:MAG: hypothetical protein ACOX2F_00170 [bacterium]
MNKTGHFNFAENRTFLLCLDIKTKPVKKILTSFYFPKNYKN